MCSIEQWLSSLVDGIIRNIVDSRTKKTPIFPVSGQNFHLIPPKNTRKLQFCGVQGVGQKCVNVQQEYYDECQKRYIVIMHICVIFCHLGLTESSVTHFFKRYQSRNVVGGFVAFKSVVCFSLKISLLNVNKSTTS